LGECFLRVCEKTEHGIVLHLPSLPREHICSKPPPYPAQNWNFGILLWITAFLPCESSTYEIPIVHRNIGIRVKFVRNWNFLEFAPLCAA
jgi:hypothetical protein